ncbi:MAG: methionyl-tRNA formyltransferase [Clostridia bacterium]|nr:methionyl-tRNA formyltransferase [Clostridia bacterium]
MKLIFMGTPEFAVPSLRALAKEHEILCVVSQPDRPKGRGYQLIPTPVKQAALELGLTVIQPEKVRDEAVIAQLAAYEPDLMVVVAYGKILPQAVLDIPKYGCINLHGSLLPKYRGAAPIEWSVINGETVTGNTTMYLAAGMDTGDIIYAEPIPVDENITGGELRVKLAESGAPLLAKTVRDIENGTAPRTAQNHGEATHAPMLTKEMGLLDFSRPAKQLHDLVRGLNPMIGAYAFAGGKKTKILRTAVCGSIHGAPGSVVLDGGKLYVCCGEGALELVELVPEGKKPMSGAAFYNGNRLKEFD